MTDKETQIKSGGEAVVEALIENGVDTVFGIPGIQNLAMYAGLERTDSRAVLISNEESAAFAAMGVPGPGRVATTARTVAKRARARAVVA